ncbi:DNA topoisomerase III family protein, partial [Lacticaseibacillus paracasei subsp. paracasei Lpp41]
TKYLGLVSKPVALTNTTPNKRYVDGKKVAAFLNQAQNNQ